MILIENLFVSVDGREILKGLNLKLEKGRVNVLMGCNGSGKSTLVNVLMGNPKYKICSGKIFFNNIDVTEMKIDERAKLGFFMAFQNPVEVSGVSVFNFLRQAYNSIYSSEKVSLLEFKQMIEKKCVELNLDKSFLDRYLNEGFSGGEKKKSEILQLLTLNPRFAILDETDSGLDVDALRVVSNGIRNFLNEDKYLLVITHHNKILQSLDLDNVFVMDDGKIVKQGGKSLINEIEENGFRGLK